MAAFRTKAGAADDTTASARRFVALDGHDVEAILVAYAVPYLLLKSYL